jgi:hypothetical protein
VNSRWSIRRHKTWALLSAPALAIATLSIAAAGPAAAHNTARAAAHALSVAQEHFTVKPNRGSNMTDCNGWSKSYTSVVPRFRENCTDPHGPLVSYRYTAPDGTTRTAKYWGRFRDNGHYVGHDEPSVKFISAAPNSANTFTWFTQLPTDPAKAPNSSGTITKYAELSPAPWFGLPLCDPASYTQKPCTPHSDANQSQINNPNAAGDAFMELQFYAPGFPPFQDNTSCSTHKWCIAITIDSLASQFGFVNLNPNCPEPVNFAYLTKNGVPGGPPSPQLANGHTFTPTANTFEVSSGDVLKVAISDPLTGPSAGFTATVTDMTKHQTGFMIASAANGFMNTNFRNCAGSPFTFHAEYNTAAQQNQVPWAALEGGVLMQQEIGHNEVCASLTHKDPFSTTGLHDGKVFDTCIGGNEGGTKTVGEGTCNPRTGVCHHAETEGTTGPIACPTNNFASGQLCEFADGFCIPKGTRTIIQNGSLVKLTMPINFCQANRFQNGDLDFDGISYRATSWPNGSSSTPTSFRYAGPFDQSGMSYPQVQFETDAPGSEFLCNLATQFNCDVPPLAARFYPYWTQTNKAGQGIDGLFPARACIWNFGNTIKGVTTRAFGKDAQFGVPDFARFGGTSITPVPVANPQISGGCPKLTAP